MHRFYRTHTMHMTYMICQPYLGQEAWEGRWGAVDREWLDKTGIVSFMLGPLPPHSLQSFLSATAKHHAANSFRGLQAPATVGR